MASQASLEANQNRIVDLSLVESYLDALAEGQIQLAEFCRSRMRDELRPAFDAWILLYPEINFDVPRSPQYMPQYHLAAEERGVALHTDADVLFKAGQEANTTSDAYVATTLFLPPSVFCSDLGTL